MCLNTRNRLNLVTSVSILIFYFVFYTLKCANYVDFFTFMDYYEYVINLLFKKEVEILLQYKIDVMHELKEVGITFTSCRENKVFSQGTLMRFRKGDANIDAETLNRLCCILELQPKDIIRYKEEPEDTKLYDSIHKQKK